MRAKLILIISLLVLLGGGRCAQFPYFPYLIEISLYLPIAVNGSVNRKMQLTASHFCSCCCCSRLTKSDVSVLTILLHALYKHRTNVEHNGNAVNVPHLSIVVPSDVGL